MIIAIDGPSGSGKSSIAKKLAKKLNILHLDTGAMYRMLGYMVYEKKIDLDKVIYHLKDLDIDIRGDKFYLNGENVTKKIRENHISSYASNVSKIKEVREYMVDLQRKISAKKSVVLDGRDIGTVVFPNADIKIYLVASPEVRAKRRALQDKKLPYKKILEDIIKRDYEDMNREHSPLKMAKDAILIDSDKLTFKQVLDKIMGIIKEYEIKSNN